MTLTRRASWRLYLILPLLLFSPPSPAVAQKKKLAISDLSSEWIAGRPAAGVTWLSDSKSFSYVVRKGAGTEASELWLEEAATGRKRLLVSTATLTLPEDPTPSEAAFPGAKAGWQYPRYGRSYVAGYWPARDG